MNWFSNILPRVNKRAAGKTVPEGVWTKCARCNTAIYSPQFEKDLWVCASCDYHHRINAEQRLSITLDADPAPVEIAAHLRPEDFCASTTGAVTRSGCGKPPGTICGANRCASRAGRSRGARSSPRVSIFRLWAARWAASLASASCAESSARSRSKSHLCAFRLRGGARMQEGLGALLQMAKTVSALAELEEKRLPFISVLTDPTMGGVGGEFRDVGRCQFDRAARAGRIRRARV